MQYKPYSLTRLLAVPALLLLFAAPAAAQVRFLDEAIPSALVEILDEGRNLEAQRRWGEALAHYEDAVREHPGNRSLVERLDLARIHYDVSRRYKDQSFRAAARGMSEEQALDVMSDVLAKIQSYHVNTPDWQRMVRRGTTGLGVALYERDFRDVNLPRADDDQIAALHRALGDLAGRYSVRTRDDATRLTTLVARTAQQRSGLSSAAVILEYTCAAAGGLDNYSTYLTADQLREVYSQIDGNFVGLGIELKAEDGALLLVGVIPGSPAERAGLRAGDRIIAVEGQSTEKLTTDEAAARLQGPEGSSVNITALTPGMQPRNLRVRREHVEVPSIEGARIVDEDLGVAYLRLTSFQKTTVRDLDAALWRLHRDGMRSLIVDLRGNPGGLLTASVEVADRFLHQGLIVSTRGRNPQEDFTYNAHRTGTWTLPLVVLIDGDSASASEILAGAIRDNRRGTVVGQRSYGKGSVQGIFPLGAGGAGIRLTTAKFYSPSGRAISEAGVQPDVLVREAARPVAGRVPQGQTDAALEAALRVSRQQLASR